MHHMRKKLLLALISTLLVFLILALAALVDLRRGIPLFGTGLPAVYENMIVILFCLLVSGRVLWEMHKV